MKIAVCFKVLPDFDQVVDEDWDRFSLSADLGYVKRIFGCFDEIALETALRLRSAWEALGKKTECTALTAGPLPSSLCKTLFAAGFDRVLDLSDAFSGRSPEFRPRYTAAVLGDYLGSAPYDLILAGRQAGYADTGTVPLLLAESLGIPVITEAGEINPCEEGVEVMRTTDTGRERLRVRLPVLAVLGNGPVPALRGVTLRALMAASGLAAERPQLSASGEAALGIAGGGGADSAGESRFRRERRSGNCRFLPGGVDLARSGAAIRAEYLKEWEG
jgi:electron transfer flavoprotein alpha/beta subunit